MAIHEVGEHQGRPYLVMDLVEGETFEALLRQLHGELLDAAGDLLLDHRTGDLELVSSEHLVEQDRLLSLSLLMLPRLDHLLAGDL